MQLPKESWIPPAIFCIILVTLGVTIPILLVKHDMTKDQLINAGTVKSVMQLADMPDTFVVVTTTNTYITYGGPAYSAVGRPCDELHRWSTIQNRQRHYLLVDCLLFRIVDADSAK